MTHKEFEDLSDRCRGKMMAIARRLNTSASPCYDCEDIVQDALMTLWQLTETGYPVTDAEGLAYRLTRNLCVKQFRRFRHEKNVPIDGIEVAGTASDIYADDIVVIKRVIADKLTETQRKYLRMRNELEMTLDQMAEETARPKNSIKATLSQARRIMIQTLSDEGKNGY